jgi:membrane-bound lytic murein transglycosylase D
MRIFAALFFAAAFPAAAQSPQVPHKMEFAGITLTIRDDARREIQKDVNALTQSPKHFAIKAERAKTYFPVIEKVFREEQVPDDFKYLALQESALIADAVSTSNAVGFWQFKDFTAMEMGLRVDKQVDERMSIVASTKAAAKYLKKNNSIFENWIYTLQSYQMGAGGVMNAVNDTKPGTSHMEINSRTYWYVKRFLAHKIAYEGGVSGRGVVSLVPYEAKNGKSLRQLAREVSVGEEELLSYNKWAKSGHVPDDRTYIVVIPVTGPRSDVAMQVDLGNNRISEAAISAKASKPIQAVKKKINGLHVIQALDGETAESLAARCGVSLVNFLQWNDLSSNEKLIAQEFYFLSRKRNKAIDDFHKVADGENLWLISQRYGVKLKQLKKFNRLPSDYVGVGEMLWLSTKRPRAVSFPAPMEDAVATNHNEAFNWTVDSNGKSSETIQLSEEAVVTNVNNVMKEADSVETLQETITEESVVVRDTIQQLQVRIEDLSRKEHIVQPKETLYSIAKMYSVGVMDLVNWNNLDLQQGIKIGQVLKLVDTQSVTQAKGIGHQVMHEVKSSDTLYSIARQYGVTIKEIMDWNQKKDFSLAVGEKLKVFQRQ